MLILFSELCVIAHQAESLARNCKIQRVFYNDLIAVIKLNSLRCHIKTKRVKITRMAPVLLFHSLIIRAVRL